MNTVFTINILLPVGWILFQNLLLLFLGVWLLRYMKIIKNPVAGMEYSQAVFAAVIILAILAIGNLSVNAVYDTYLNYSALEGGWIRSALFTYCQFFLVTLCALLILGIISWVMLRIFLLTSKNEETIGSGNLPLSIMMSGIFIGFSFGIGKLLLILLEGMMPRVVLIN